MITIEEARKFRRFIEQMATNVSDEEAMAYVTDNSLMYADHILFKLVDESGNALDEAAIAEKKAQAKAYDILEREHLVTAEELDSLKELFHLYNVQYVNDIILSSLELIYTALEIAIALKGDSK